VHTRPVPITVQIPMEILVCLAALPLLLIAPLIEAWQKHREHRDQHREALRTCRLLYGPAPPHDRDTDRPHAE
jgi:hypothetical protein